LARPGDPIRCRAPYKPRPSRLVPEAPEFRSDLRETSPAQILLAATLAPVHGYLRWTSPQESLESWWRRTFPADLRLLTLGSNLSAAQFWKTAWAASPAHCQRKSLPTEAQLFRTSRTQRRWADFPLCSKYSACSQSRSNQTPSRRQVVGDRKIRAMSRSQ